ncbi:DUF1772 domain-containing protein [Ectothiorhodospiraceae bacterium WFHF3C12]|nr:DUF1772 domain-containing protein [Ectothiorhodospiraceae bacterium WFHF3C12]
MIEVLLWLTAIGTGLVAGLFFAFSTFVMTALAAIPQSHGIAAMQAINTVILRSLFMPLFFGTTLAGLVLAGYGLLHSENPASAPALAGGTIYFVGMFLCTVVFNVPLNNRLAAVTPSAEGSSAVWRRYLKEWTAWNHVRTMSSTVACALYLAAIAAT